MSCSGSRGRDRVTDAPSTGRSTTRSNCCHTIRSRPVSSSPALAGAQIRFVVNAGNIQREDWLIYTQQALQDVGIEVIPETAEWATLVSAVTERREFEVVGGDFAGVTAEPTELYEDFHTNGTSNYSSYSNPELDALLEQARETVDIEAAKPIYSEIQKIIIEEVLFSPGIDRSPHGQPEVDRLYR